MDTHQTLATRLSASALVGPHFPIIPLNALFALAAASSANILALCLVLPIFVWNLHQPVILARLVGALVAPFRDPFSRGFVVNEVLASLLFGEGGAGFAAVFADSFLLGE